MNLKGETVRIRLKGHAGFAAEGQDIVCAAATTLCNTLVGYFETKPGQKQKQRLEKGDIEICIDLKEQPEAIWEIVCFAAVGFQLIEQSFPLYFGFKKNF